MGFPEWVEEGPGTPFLPYAEKRIRTRTSMGKLGADHARRYQRYPLAIAGSLKVAPTLVDQIEADPELALAVAQDPAQGRRTTTSVGAGTWSAR